tara:strand:+ start:1395 stop:1568 length:174 start_codon:yes stop_codon:yes gene_type:complete
VSSHKYLANKIDREHNLNVVNLIKQAKIERKKERRKNVIVAAAAVSALAISGIIITF